MRRETQTIMAMPCTIQSPESVDAETFRQVFDYLRWVDETFSTFKPTSEIGRIDHGELEVGEASPEVREVLRLAEETKRETDGYFDVRRGDRLDPSGLVKGWAITRAARLLRESGLEAFSVEVAGDFEVAGTPESGRGWRLGIRDPFAPERNVKSVELRGGGMATSGAYLQGEHIDDPHTGRPPEGVASLTVIGPSAYEADRFATAAYAMGGDGVKFIEQREVLEGYLIDADGMATMTRGFERYVV